MCSATATVNDANTHSPTDIPSYTEKKELDTKAMLGAKVLTEAIARIKYYGDNDISKPYYADEKLPVGTLVIPVRDIRKWSQNDSDNLLGVQYITPDGSKSYQPTLRKDESQPTGAMILADKHEDIFSMLFVCEGYATGVSLRQFLGMPVFCTGDVSTLPYPYTVDLLTSEFPDSRIVVCANIDSRHAGTDTAKLCLKYFKNTEYMVPDFSFAEKEIAYFDKTGKPMQTIDKNGTLVFDNVTKSNFNDMVSYCRNYGMTDAMIADKFRSIVETEGFVSGELSKHFDKDGNEIKNPMERYFETYFKKSVESTVENLEAGLPKKEPFEPAKPNLTEEEKQKKREEYQKVFQDMVDALREERIRKRGIPEPTSIKMGDKFWDELNKNEKELLVNYFMNIYPETSEEMAYESTARYNDEVLK
ncbi:MAG: hypothetical protein WAX69_15420, partial [Victivallales bacterium]